MRRSYISPEEMNNLASSILEKAGHATSWHGIIEKTDIDALIEFEYGLDIKWENIDHLADDGVVLAAIAPARKIIYMNDSQRVLFKEKMGTMNFSKAHELGHWVLHVTEQQDYEQLSFAPDEMYYCRNTLRRSPEEVQADMFAASILMPREIISGAIDELKINRRVTFPDLYRMKDAFEVSISALTNRLHELNLLYIAPDKKIYFSEAEAMGQFTFL